MRLITKGKLIYKLLILTVLISALTLVYTLSSQNSKATVLCADDVYDYCWSQNRPVDPYTCECNISACLFPIASDCTEVGNHFDSSTCTCVANPSEVGVCDIDPFALGCPRSFDTVFAGQIRILQGCTYPNWQYDPACNPMIGGGTGDICSFESHSWCVTNGGSWSSYGCACSGVSNPGRDAEQTCGDVQGRWYNPGNVTGGGVCYNPSNIGSAYQCSTSTQTLSSCAASGGAWNPYTCVCTPT
jgi:hypothetical protein